jgi:hypothetical protein
VVNSGVRRNVEWETACQGGKGEREIEKSKGGVERRPTGTSIRNIQSSHTDVHHPKIAPCDFLPSASLMSDDPDGASGEY